MLKGALWWACEGAAPGPSISVRACRDFSQCGGLSSGRESKLFPEEAGIPGERRENRRGNGECAQEE